MRIGCGAGADGLRQYRDPVGSGPVVLLLLSAFPISAFQRSPSLLLAENSDTVRNMTVEQIKEEVSNLPETQQDLLVAYVVHLRHMRDASARQELSRRMDDRDPAHWISVDQLKEHWKE